MHDSSDGLDGPPPAPGRHAAPDHLIMIPVSGNDLAEYGILSNDHLVIDTREIPDDGRLGLVRSRHEELIACVFYQGGGNLLLVTPAHIVVVGEKDEPEIVGKVTAIQHYLG